MFTSDDTVFSFRYINHNIVLQVIDMFIDICVGTRHTLTVMHTDVTYVLLLVGNNLSSLDYYGPTI
jgi:hypothetical protein